MSRNTLTRLARLERSGSERQATLMVTCSAEAAAKLQARHPGAMVIITGVQRSLTERLA